MANKYDHTELKVIHDGSQSEDLFKNEFFRSKVNDLETIITNSWKQSETPEGRERQWIKLQLLKELIVELELPLLMKQHLEHQKEVENDSEGY